MGCKLSTLCECAGTDSGTFVLTFKLLLQYEIYMNKYI